MASGAVWYQTRRGIINDITIVRVTRYTHYVQIVIARVIWIGMTEVVGRRPALRRMTTVALRRGVKMAL